MNALAFQQQVPEQPSGTPMAGGGQLCPLPPKGTPAICVHSLPCFVLDCGTSIPTGLRPKPHPRAHLQALSLRQAPFGSAGQSLDP